MYEAFSGGSRLRRLRHSSPPLLHHSLFVMFFLPPIGSLDSSSDIQLPLKTFSSRISLCQVASLAVAVLVVMISNCGTVGNGACRV